MNTQSEDFIKQLAQEYLLKLGRETHGYINKDQLLNKPTLNKIINDLIESSWMTDICDEYYEINPEAVDQHIKEVEILMTKIK